MKFWQKAMGELFYAGLPREDCQKVQPELWKRNRRSLIDWSVSLGAFWSLSLLMSLYATAYARCRTVYFAGLASCAVTLLWAAFFAKRAPRTLFAAMRLFDVSALGAGIGIALCQPDVRTVTMIAVAMILPIFFIEATAFSGVVFLLGIAVFAAAGKALLVPDIYSWSLLNLSIFSAAGTLVGHFINKERFERYVYAQSVTQLADLRTRYAYYDQMTGLKNRRAYAETLERLSGNPPRHCCVVVADVNGLKAVNDDYGHEAGDELIIGAADCVRLAFHGVENIYRLGGDEFCVILEEPAENARRCLERLDWASANWKGRHIHGVSLSYGMASEEDSPDIEAIAKEADLRMYEYKRNYYRATGRARRKG